MARIARTVAAIASAAAVTVTAYTDDASITLAPVGTGNAAAVTADGSTVVLYDGWTGMLRLWHPADGSMESIGQVYGFGGITPDGSMIAGTIDVNGMQTAAFWTAAEEAWTPIGGLFEDGCDAFLSTGYDISDDGGTIVGLGWEGCSGRAFRWDANTGEMVAMTQEGTRSARANAVSADSSHVGGWEEAESGFRRPAFWDADGMVHILREVPGEVWGFTPDNRVIFGDAGSDTGLPTAALWIEGTYVDLGVAPGQTPFTARATVLAMNDAGTLAGGLSGGTFPGDIKHGFLWNETDGMRRVRDVLSAAGVSGLPPIIWSVTDMTPDGRVIVGGVPDEFGFNIDGYIATLPGGETCDGDVDGDGTVGVNDLLTVLADWGACPGCASDLDGDDVVGVSDLLIVLAAWGDC